MKKKRIYIGLLFIAILSFITVMFLQFRANSEAGTDRGKDVEAITDKKIEKMIQNMTLEEKIGQLMVVGFKGTEKSNEITELIEQKHMGGVIYFDRNMKSPKQVAKLSNSLQQTANQSSHSLPLMVAVDQEGGDIIRMRERVSPLPAQKDMGEQASVEDIYNVAKLNGTELSSMGININFAPVLDLSDTDKRSLGKDPEKVYQYGKKAIQGLNDASVTGALKHFPGNGRSEIDPHVETSSVEANQLDLENSDIYPFKKIISEMENPNFFVMVTHIKYPAYDKEKPASLSKVIIEDLLRGKLKYEGLVITDDLEMGAVNKYFSYEDMGKEAILAGADLLLVCHEYTHELEVYNGLLEAVKAGEVPMERINESVKRVLTYKVYNLKQAKVDPDLAQKVVKSPESLKYLESLNLDK
ncbi:Beta-hexosaminidase [Peribacillus sp. Bi96]|uniref:glycoside hydrolase family 3 N-terminal domain-containing protein n=1 Tax=Peribacillus sp. Bi96 TaxID=2884273 RepID=UPI001D5FA745|nr:glycoside hydrolase family 3 N-terminal domain-containing protein [Peribacillus sp. Bi96]CAH0256712.1 Beta-hexosaminidase [Peribacillus sp. Bi96]